MLRFYSGLTIILLSIYVTYGANNKTTLLLEHNLNLSLAQKSNLSDLPHMEAFMTEAGKIVPGSPATLSHENSSILLSLDKEFASEKKRPIKPRKEAILTPEEVNSTLSHQLKHSMEDKVIIKNITKIPLNDLKLDNISSPVHADTNGTLMPIKLNDTKSQPKKIYKPELLSFEELSKMEKDISSHSIPLPVLSSKSIISDQIPSPNDIGNKVSYGSNTNKHPGMITPLIITIMVLPMFAVLGYLALKRGREAWKNRHYKRMDFLLDGMYNE